MNTEAIKQAIGHKWECACCSTKRQPGMPLHHNCNCSRREMIAWLERLEEPVAWETMRNGTRQVYYREDIAKAMSDDGILRPMIYAEGVL